LQERARAARYALLADCAREAHSKCAIVTAHHADDQAETILFRLTRGSGVAGLAGMAPASARQDVALLRPLLGVTKAALEAVCIEAGHPFLRDPSNEDAIFARARLRKLGATLETLGLTRDALLRLGDRAARAEAALAWSARRAREAALMSQDGDGAQFSASVLRDMPREMLLRLLATEIVTMRGVGARLDRLERAAETLAYHLDRRVAGRTTLAGVSIRWDNLTVTLTLAPPRASQRKIQGEDAENGI
jgi:tRNA(Ile)-lysidine synthase